MRITLFHNRYLERGGEDVVVETDAALLRDAGHDVSVLHVDTRDALSGGWASRMRLGLRAVWNPDSFRQVQEHLRRTRPDVGIVHNTFPRLSPAVYDAHRREGVPVLQVVHNFRLVCANGTLVRRQRRCDECVTRGPWNAVRHGCYRDSRLQTAAWARTIAAHHQRGTWAEQIDAYVAPSESTRVGLIQGGFPADKIHVRPHPVPDPGNPRSGGTGAVFVGRLSVEKGARLLLEAWRQLDTPLTIVGDGPLAAWMRTEVETMPHVRLLGRRDAADVHEAMRRARLLVAPSLAPETFGLAVQEALACGTPAVVPHDGALAELIESGVTGLTHQSGDVTSFVDAVQRLDAQPAFAAQLGGAARAEYERARTPRHRVDRLIELARSVLRKPARSPTPSRTPRPSPVEVDRPS